MRKSRYKQVQGALVFSQCDIYFGQNSVFENGGLGIDIGINAYGGGVNSNDPGDGDAGSNTLLNFPEFTVVSASLVDGTACDGYSWRFSWSPRIPADTVRG